LHALSGQPAKKRARGTPAALGSPSGSGATRARGS
jgi:hypothetical protein